MSLAVEGPVTDHLHATHELPDLDYCSICMGEFLDAIEPADPKAPARAWFQDPDGYVKTDA